VSGCERHGGLERGACAHAMDLEKHQGVESWYKYSEVNLPEPDLVRGDSEELRAARR
jgi:hypothetical protein